MHGTLKALGAATATAALVGAGIAVAGAPSGTDTIRACAQKRSGQLRTVAAGKKCRKTERTLSWSRTGAKGAPGAPGPAGAQGAAGTAGAAGGQGERGLQGVPGVKGDEGDKGETGPSDVYFDRNGASTALGTSGLATLGSLTVPAGTYLVHATVRLSLPQNNPGVESAVCTVSGQPISGFASVPPDSSLAGSFATVSLSGVVTATGQTTLQLACGPEFSDDTHLTGTHLGLSAQLIGTLHDQS